MNKSRFWVKLISLTLTLTITPTIAAQLTLPPPAPEVLVSKIYQLHDISESKDVCDWIQSSIPEMVQPGTWRGQIVPPTGSLSYDAKSGLLAIRHSAAAHVELVEFLKKVKSKVKEPSAASHKSSVRSGTVMPAQYGASDVAKSEGGQSYPVPAPLQQPKHLFHFVFRFEGSGMDSAVADLTKKLTAGDLAEASKEAAKEDAGKMPLNQLLHLIVRYEGEGLIDANVVEFMKAYAKIANQEREKLGGDPLIGEVHPRAIPGPAFPVLPQPVPGPLPTPGTSIYQVHPSSIGTPVPFPPAPPPSPPTSMYQYITPATKSPAGVNLYLEESRATPAQSRPVAGSPGILQVTMPPVAVDDDSPKKQPITLEDIVRMTRSGFTPQVIINQINATGSTYTLNAEQLNWLSLQGVSITVVEHMQACAPGSGGPHTSPMGS